MRIKTYSKLRYAKTVIAGSLVGATVAFGGLSLVNCAITGQFRPFVSEDDKVETHKLVSHVYSKGKEEIYNSYVMNKNPKKVFAYKYLDPKDKTDEYQFWDVSKLTSAEFKKSYSYLSSKNIYDLNNIQDMMSEHAVCLDDNVYDYQKYFDVKDEYGLVYIKNEDILNDIKTKKIIKSPDTLPMLYLVDGIVFVSLSALGATIGLGYAKKEKTKRKCL